MGDHIFEKYGEAKQAEWDDYKTKVTPWEIDSYFVKY